MTNSLFRQIKVFRVVVCNAALLNIPNFTSYKFEYMYAFFKINYKMSASNDYVSVIITKKSEPGIPHKKLR